MCIVLTKACIGNILIAEIKLVKFDLGWNYGI